MQIQKIGQILKFLVFGKPSIVQLTQIRESGTLSKDGEPPLTSASSDAYLRLSEMTAYRMSHTYGFAFTLSWCPTMPWKWEIVSSWCRVVIRPQSKNKCVEACTSRNVIHVDVDEVDQVTDTQPSFHNRRMQLNKLIHGLIGFWIQDVNHQLLTI